MIKNCRFKKRYLLIALSAAWLAGCNSGSSTPSTGTTACNPCTVYVTNTLYGGNILESAVSKYNFAGESTGSDGQPTGIYAADFICNNDPKKPATGIYKAFIVDGKNRVACSTGNCNGYNNTSTDWVLHPNTTYVWAEESGATTFAWQTGNNSLFESTTLIPNIIGNHTSYWTGFQGTDWTAPTATTANCHRFTTAGNTPSSAAYVGSIYGTRHVGTTTTNGLSAINSGSSKCSDSTNIMCVQQ